ncbi:MAG: hypothetical protein ACRECD_09680 [Burkholderiaceae bacterium]
MSSFFLSRGWAGTWHTLALLALLGGMGPARGQDAAKALHLFQSLLRPAPAARSVPAARTGDLIELLSQSLDQIDEPREIEIGRQLSAVLLGSKPLHPDLALQRYLNPLGRWISLQSARPELPWTFAVLDDPGFNAVAAPDNPLFALSLSTHPPAQQRLDQLEQAMGRRLDGLALQPPVTVAQRLERLTAASRAKAGPGAAQTAPGLRSPFGPKD